MVTIVPYSANYTEALQDLTIVTKEAWSEQHRHAQASRRKESSHYLPNFLDFFDIYNPFKALVYDFSNIATGVIKSDDIYVDFSVDIGVKIDFGLHNKKLCEISNER